MGLQRHTELDVHDRDQLFQQKHHGEAHVSGWGPATKSRAQEGLMGGGGGGTEFEYDW